MFTEPVRASRAPRGFSLLELIFTIVIVSAAIAAVTSVFLSTTKGSVDPMLHQQAQLVAEAYLEEILLKRFVDPEDDKVCPAQEAGGRTAYDNVCDYRGLSDNPPKDQLGNSLTDLAAYTVSVTVTPSPSDPTGAVTLGTLSNDYTNGYIRVLRVDVSVSTSSGINLTLTGYRTNYNCNATIAVGQCRPLT
jgi:MSHA pilin protein MshD